MVPSQGECGAFDIILDRGEELRRQSTNELAIRDSVTKVLRCDLLINDSAEF